MKSKVTALALRSFQSIIFIIFSFSFMRGCDPTSSLTFKIENQTNSEIDVTLYGWEISYKERKDSTVRMATGEIIRVYNEEQMGTVGPAPRNSIYFADSIRVVHVNKAIVSLKDTKDINEWVYRKSSSYGGEHRLTIDEDDFTIGRVSCLSRTMIALTYIER